MIEEIRNRSADLAKDLTGVVAQKMTELGVGPFLFQDGADFSELVIEPRYPVSETVSKIQKHFKDIKIGVVARGCDVRALVEMAKRKQVDPERLVILGITCSQTQADACHCEEPYPRLEEWPAGEVLGEKASPAEPNPLVVEHREMAVKDRWKFWQAQFTKCIKCYGCRDICPVCFCDACALEDPLWVEPGLLVPDFPMYHLIKAMHMTTRCVACRQCEIACPSGIPLTVLYDLISEDVKDLIGYKPGAKMDELPPLSLTLADAPMESELAG
jgi:ferredoxin